MKFKTVIFSLIFLLTVSQFYSCKKTTKKPNIIIILADDLGYGDPEVYNPDSKIPTPNINLLAEKGMIFTDAHTPSSVCTPTRYGLLTGRYAWRTELKNSVLWMWDRPLIDSARQTLPKMLKSETTQPHV
ncbi:sulfatase-like hydrolase/transferase [Aureibaculum sp. 2210JD6-5]|nr:sulfatase-like hydrolase/transferase [Aureibaculum sp. 2210JD6-5]MDY7394514.1 sulfatase-like hydrolase/transferase [Aureibaculum sp. 2210JD6-5]